MSCAGNSVFVWKLPAGGLAGVDVLFSGIANVMLPKGVPLDDGV